MYIVGVLSRIYWKMMRNMRKRCISTMSSFSFWIKKKIVNFSLVWFICENTQVLGSFKNNLLFFENGNFLCVFVALKMCSSLPIFIGHHNFVHCAAEYICIQINPLVLTHVICDLLYILFLWKFLLVLMIMKIGGIYWEFRWCNFSFH